MRHLRELAAATALPVAGAGAGAGATDRVIVPGVWCMRSISVDSIRST